MNGLKNQDILWKNQVQICFNSKDMKESLVILRAPVSLDAFPIPISTVDAIIGVVELGMGDGSLIFTTFNFHFH